MSRWTEEECWEYADWKYDQRADKLAEKEEEMRDPDEQEALEREQLDRTINGLWERIDKLKADNAELRKELAEHLGRRIEDLELHFRYGQGTYLQVDSDRFKALKQQWERRITELEKGK